ncbi:protein nemuri-like [Impatiens glandulifera]|uniref:protein nemuri-like n=1 Tax=Impatiens glandulifera TaxID=253017 RepID=UPI001FB0DEA1|nr:protein nemuri-like [Impatiens glandulifera]
MQGCMNRKDNERQDFAENLARKFQAKEDALGNAESAQPRPVQGESSRRNDGVATGTRSRRALCSDDNPRPTKRGGGRSDSERGGRNGGGRSRLSNVDQGGRGSVAERGGRSNAGGRGGRGYSHFMNKLHEQEMTFRILVLLNGWCK